MKIALIHDWLTGMRGGERVLEVLCELYPEADIFTLIHIKGSVSETIESHKIITSKLQKKPFVEKKYRYYLPSMPKAIENFDLKDYDLIISSSHCVAKGVKPRNGALHICYCYTPMRYIWDMYDEYFGKGRANFITRMAMNMSRPKLKKWDVESSKRVDYFIAISNHIAQRIKTAYNRDSVVIYPPVNTDKFSISNEQVEDFYLIVSAFAPYKRIDLAIKAFNKLGYQLKIIGEGQENKKLKKIAGSNIEFLGWQPDEIIRRYYSKCKALIFPGEEDFGIVPVEAMACGRPVIAYKKGGALETVIDGETGLFFYPQEEEELINAIKQSESINWDSAKTRAQSFKFDNGVFKDKMRSFVEEKVKEKFK